MATRASGKGAASVFYSTNFSKETACNLPILLNSTQNIKKRNK